MPRKSKESKVRKEPKASKEPKPSKGPVGMQKQEQDKAEDSLELLRCGGLQRSKTESRGPF